MTMTIRLRTGPRSGPGTVVRFSMTTPTLTRDGGPAYRQIAAVLETLTPSEREAVLLSLCHKYETPTPTP